MNTKPVQVKKQTDARRNTIETGDRANDFFDFFESSPRQINSQEKQNQVKNIRKEFSLFSYNQYYENELVKKQIKELIEQVRKEIQMLKKAENSLLTDIKDAEKLTVDQLPEKQGVYHIRFMEVILTILRSLRAKVGESRTWLQAMVTKRKKRGSLFLSLSKKKGTQFSLSQELQSSRSVQ